MPISFELMEVSQYRVRYLATISGEDDPTTGIITNRLPPDTGLRTDTGGVFKSSPINRLVSTPVANQAAARRLLQGDGLTSRLNLEVERGHVRIIPRSTFFPITTFWAVDMNEGAAAGDALSAGFAVIVVGGPGRPNQDAYIDLYFEHSFDR